MKRNIGNENFEGKVETTRMYRYGRGFLLRRYGADCE